MRDVDAVRLRELLGHLADSRRRLGEAAALSEVEFLSDARNPASAKYLLIVAAEAAIDVCNHIVARRGGRAPEDYADCFGVLAELGVLGGGLAERLKGMARLRNLIVHLYWRVDDSRIYRVLQDDLGDLDEYVTAIVGWLKET